jgi:hypothetical protein
MIGCLRPQAYATAMPSFENVSVDSLTSLNHLDLDRIEKVVPSPLLRILDDRTIEKTWFGLLVACVS